MAMKITSMDKVKGIYSREYDCTAFFDDGSLCLGFWGEIYDTVDAKAPALALARRYRDEGAKGLCNLNGRYLVAVVDRATGKLLLINDRYGFKRCYYRTEGPFDFSTDYASLANAPSNGGVDEQAVADLLFLGFVPGERTLHRGIRLLPPASVLAFDRGGVEIKRYWDFSFPAEGSTISHAEYLGEFYRRVLGAVEKMADGRDEILLPLSGGLDSRTVAGALYRSGYKGRVNAFSYGQRDSYDVVYGRKIASALGYPHEFLPIPGDYLARYSERFVQMTDGTINCLNSHTMLLYDRFGGRPASLLTGFLGDVLTGTNFNGKFLGAGAEETILKTFEVPPGQLDWLRGCLKKDVFERIADVTIPWLKARFERACSADPFYRAHYLTLSERQRRYVAFNIYSYERLGEVLAPFTDNAFIDFALALPREFLFDQGLYKEMIVKYLPEVAAVEYGKTRLPLSASRLRKGLQWRWERLNRNSLVRATLGRRYSRMNDNYLNADESVRRSGVFVAGLLNDNPFLSEYLRMERVRSILDGHLRGEVNEYGKLTTLLTLALWHRLFVEGSACRAQGLRAGQAI